MTNSIENKNQLPLYEGLVITIITAAAYLSCFLREIGYAQIFDIPLEVISVNYIGIVVTAGSFLIAISTYILKVNLIWIFSPRGEAFIARKARMFIAASLVLGFAFYPYFITKIYVWAYVILIGVLFFYQFIFPLITQRKVKNYEEKLIAQHAIEDKSVDVYKTFMDMLPRQWLTPFMLMSAIMIFSYGHGRKEALEKSSFFAVDGKAGWYVLKIYNDIIITAPIDLRTKQTRGEMEFTKLEDGGSIRLHKVEIGIIDHADNSKQKINNDSVKLQKCNGLEVGCWDA